MNAGSLLRAMTALERRGLLAALVLVIGLMFPVRGYLTDDTFIHLQYARHLAEGRGLEFNPGEPVYGCTSPLWVALLADGMALGVDGVRWARVLGALATLVSVALFYVLLRRTLRSPALRVAGTVAWAAHAWMARWSLSGMETPLAVALTLAGFVALVSGPRWGSRPVLTGACWSLAALARPELVLLLGLWAALQVVSITDRSGMRRLAAGIAPAVLIYGGWLLYARLHFHAWWPQTLAAKTAGTASLAFHLDNLGRQLQVLGATDAVVGALALFGAVVLLRQRPVADRGRALEVLPWLWVVGLPASYMLRGVPVLSRYLLILVPILAWLAWRALDDWETRSGRSRAGVAVVVAGLMVLQNLVVYRSVVIPQVESFTRGLQTELIPWARWFGEHSPPDAAIATPDIGVFGYFSRRPILDLAGLITPGMVRYLENETQEEVIARFRFAAIARPAFLVDRGGGEYRLLKDSPFARSLVPLGLARVPNLGVARREPATYSFYRIDWTAFDSLRVGPPR